jgi:hypothetical protein
MFAQSSLPLNDDAKRLLRFVYFSFQSHENLIKLQRVVRDEMRVGYVSIHLTQ